MLVTEPAMGLQLILLCEFNIRTRRGYRLMTLVVWAVYRIFPEFRFSPEIRLRLVLTRANNIYERQFTIVKMIKIKYWQKGR